MEPSSWNETLKQIIFHATNPLIKLQFRGWNNSGVSREWHRLGIDQVLKEGLNFPEFFHQNYPCNFHGIVVCCLVRSNLSEFVAQILAGDENLSNQQDP